MSTRGERGEGRREEHAKLLLTGISGLIIVFHAIDGDSFFSAEGKSDGVVLKMSSDCFLGQLDCETLGNWLLKIAKRLPKEASP